MQVPMSQRITITIRSTWPTVPEHAEGQLDHILGAIAEAVNGAIHAAAARGEELPPATYPTLEEVAAMLDKIGIEITYDVPPGV